MSYTIATSLDAGLPLHNEALLLTTLSRAPIRTGAQSATYRKFGKAHRNVLAFVTGDWKMVVAASASVKVSDDLFASLETAG